MTYQTILAYHNQSARSRSPLETAIRLARDFAARLVSVYLDDAPEIAPSLAALLPGDTVEQYMRDALEAQREAESAFRRSALTAGVTDVDWRAPSGPPLDAAVAHARCADLTVVSQPAPEQAGWSLAARLVTAVLLEGGRPVLVVPYVGAPEVIGTNVVIAWDGGREASRAVADALPILVRARKVTIACLDPSASARGADTGARDRLLAYLRRHGVAARVESDNLDEADIGIGDWLLSRVADLSGDLIVMGGYGHSRWREQVLGGATRALLAEMTVPVLMAH